MTHFVWFILPLHCAAPEVFFLPSPPLLSCFVFHGRGIHIDSFGRFCFVGGSVVHFSGPVVLSRRFYRGGFHLLRLFSGCG